MTYAFDGGPPPSRACDGRVKPGHGRTRCDTSPARGGGNLLGVLFAAALAIQSIPNQPFDGGTTPIARMNVSLISTGSRGV